MPQSIERIQIRTILILQVQCRFIYLSMISINYAYFCFEISSIHIIWLVNNTIIIVQQQNYIQNSHIYWMLKKKISVKLFESFFDYNQSQDITKAVVKSKKSANCISSLQNGSKKELGCKDQKYIQVVSRPKQSQLQHLKVSNICLPNKGRISIVSSSKQSHSSQERKIHPEKVKLKLNNKDILNSVQSIDFKSQDKQTGFSIRSRNEVQYEKQAVFALENRQNHSFVGERTNNFIKTDNTCFQSQLSGIRLDEDINTPIRNFKFDEDPIATDSQIKLYESFVNDPQIITICNNEDPKKHKFPIKSSSMGVSTERSKQRQKKGLFFRQQSINKRKISLLNDKMEKNNQINSIMEERFKFKNQHQLIQSPIPIKNEKSLGQFSIEIIDNRKCPKQLLQDQSITVLSEKRENEQNTQHNLTSLSEQLYFVNSQRKEIEGRISRKLDQLSQRASSITRLYSEQSKSKIDMPKKVRILCTQSQRISTKDQLHTEQNFGSPSDGKSLSKQKKEAKYKKIKLYRKQHNNSLNPASNLRHTIIRKIYS